MRGITVFLSLFILIPITGMADVLDDALKCDTFTDEATCNAAPGCLYGTFGCSACTNLTDENRNLIAIPTGINCAKTDIHTLTLNWKCPCDDNAQSQPEERYYAAGVGWAYTTEDLLRKALGQDAITYDKITLPTKVCNGYTATWDSSTDISIITKAEQLTAKLTYTVTANNVNTTCTYDEDCELSQITHSAGYYNQRWSCVYNGTELATDNVIDKTQLCKLPSPVSELSCNITGTECEKGYYCINGKRESCPAGKTTDGTGAQRESYCHYAAGPDGTQFCDGTGKCFTLPAGASISSLQQ